MEKLLVTAREVSELLSMSEESFRTRQDFPEPVSLPDAKDEVEIQRNYWRLSEVVDWVKGLDSRRTPMKRRSRE